MLLLDIMGAEEGELKRDGGGASVEGVDGARVA